MVTLFDWQKYFVLWLLLQQQCFLFIPVIQELTQQYFHGHHKYSFVLVHSYICYTLNHFPRFIKTGLSLMTKQGNTLIKMAYFNQFKGEGMKVVLIRKGTKTWTQVVGVHQNKIKI